MSNASMGAVSIGQLPPMSTLLAFESVARNQSLARAASELGVTRSALTHSIAQLEHRLKLKLVLRYSPLVALTPVGHAYFAASQAFARRLRDDHYAKSTTARTQIRVSSSLGLARLWLGPRLGDFHARHPRIDLIVTAGDRLESVLGDGVDVGLRYGGPAFPNMRSIPLWQDDLVAVGNLRHAREAKFMAVEELVTSLPLVEHPSLSWAVWADGHLSRSMVIRPRLTTVDLHFGLECAAQGVGLAIVPRRLALKHLSARLVHLASDHFIPAKPYHAVVSEEQAQREPMQRLLDWLAQQVGADASSRNAGGLALSPAQQEAPGL